MCGVEVLDVHASIVARVEAERQRRIEETRRQTIANAIATIKARLEAEAAARERANAPSKTFVDGGSGLFEKRCGYWPVTSKKFQD